MTTAMSAMSDLSVEAWLAEYNCLRREIEWLINDATKYQALSISIVALVAPGIAWTETEAPRLVIPALLSVPFVVTLLGFLFYRQHEEVHVIAVYLRDYVRPQIRTALRDTALWGWEEFKAERHRALRETAVIRGISSSTVVILLRSMLFVAPSLVALTLAGVKAEQLGLAKLTGEFRGIGVVGLAGYAFIDVVLVIALSIYLLRQGDLGKRIMTPVQSGPEASMVSRTRRLRNRQS
jgi:hypothetical protein